MASRKSRSASTRRVRAPSEGTASSPTGQAGKRKRRLWLFLLVGLFGAAVAAGLWIVTRGEQALPTPEEALAAAKDAPSDRAIQILYPREGVLFPPDIAAPTFRWKDAQARTDTWVVAVGEGGHVALSPLLTAAEWTPSDEQWETIKKASAEKVVPVAVYGLMRSSPRRIRAAGSVSIRTSGDEVGAPIFYREVNLPFVEAVKDPTRIRWRFGPVSSRKQPPVLLTNLPVCGNCHSFSADGAVFGMDVDYSNDKGSYAISPVSRDIVLDDEKIITWSDYRREDGEQTFGLLSQVSPSGRYVVSTVKDLSVFVPQPDLAYSQLFFPLKGILVVYDRRDKGFRPLGGADDPEMVQSNACWSPDEKEIVFARTRAHKLKKVGNRALLNPDVAAEFLKGGKTFLYDLYRVPFNDGKGGAPEPLAGASANGKSNYFPRYSPDGKWIVFCQARTFMLLQPDSELYIVPARGGEARRLECNLPGMNSWHSWSPNGKWLVFSSKVNGPYTQLFLSHIDAEGHSSSPVLLERFTSHDRAANIPEFVAVRPDAIATMRERFVDDVSFFRAGVQFIRSGNDVPNAEKTFQKALAVNPKCAAAHVGMGVVLDMKGNNRLAMWHLEKAVEYSPRYVSAYGNLGHTLHLMGQHERAAACFQKAAELDPTVYQIYNNWGTLLVDQGKFAEAVEMFQKALKLNPEYFNAYHNMAIAFGRLGQSDKADQYFGEAEKLNPRRATMQSKGFLMDEALLYDSPAP